MVIMKIRVNVKKATWAKLPFKDTLAVNRSSLFSLNSPLSPSQIASYPLLMVSAVIMKMKDSVPRASSLLAKTGSACALIFTS